MGHIFSSQSTGTHKELITSVQLAHICWSGYVDHWLLLSAGKSEKGKTLNKYFDHPVDLYQD